MLDRDRSLAERMGGKAIALATRFDDAHTLTAAELVVGTAILVSGDLTGRALSDRAVERAEKHGFHDLKALALLNTGSSYGELYMFPEAERDLLAGTAFARKHDLDLYENYMLAWLALVRLYQGKWDEAGELAVKVIATPNLAATSKVMALAALGRLRARRGDSNWREALDEGLVLAENSGTLQRIAPIRCARAEAYFLACDVAQAAHESEAAFDRAMAPRHAWHVGEMSYWQMRCGFEPAVQDWVAEPFAHQLSGNWRAAALAWELRGCPYEQARALGEGDPAAKLRALEIFNRLGAVPAASALRKVLRGAGVEKIPRGPRASTKGNSRGLTQKELAVLPLMAKAFTNAEIARELRISPKTVDHHVSAILSKLGAANRREAGRLAEEEGLLAQI
jgi:DNA-binding CsgD family transcriptional regulator